MTAVRAIVVIGFSALLVALAGPPMFADPPWPYSGLHLRNVPIGSRIVVNVDRDSPAYRAGLRTGDALGCLSPRDVTRLFDVNSPNVRYTPDAISLCALRDDAWHRFSFLPKAMPPPGLMYGSPWIAALRLAVFIVFLFVGCALVIARPSLMTWLLFGYCCANVPDAAAIGMLVWMPADWYSAQTALTQFLTFLGSSLLALFTLVVPENLAPPGWRRWLFYATAAAAIANIIFVEYGTFSTTISHGPIVSQIDEAFTVLTVLLVVARLATMERADRARFGWAAFAIIFGIICNVVRFRNDVLNSTVSVAGGVLTIVMPICLMYAILRRHVIDVRFVIGRGVVYGIVTTLVIAIIGLVDWATSAYLSQARAALAIDAAVTIALGIALHRSYRWIEHAVDAVLFHKKHEAQAYLRRAARAILRARDERAIDETLCADPVEKLDLTMAALFRRGNGRYVAASAAGWDVPCELSFAPGSELTRFLEAERARLAIADLRKHVTAEFVEAGALPAVVIPIFRGDDLLAFALYGLHRDGTQLDPDELEALEHLCECAAQAYIMVELNRYEAPVSVSLPAMEAP